MTFFKEINGILLKKAKREALSPDSNEDLCSVSSIFDTTPPHICSKCTSDIDKETYAICVKNKAEASESAELFKIVCYTHNISATICPKIVSDNPAYNSLPKPLSTMESSTLNDLTENYKKNLLHQREKITFCL